MNRFKQAKRDAKVARLVDEIDHQVSTRHGIDPLAEAYRVVNAMASWTPEVWAQLALLAAVVPPSADSISDVVAVYVRRAVNQQRRAS